jgi:hypothetical protein
LPGLGQPAAERRRALRMLRAAQNGPRLGLGRAATLADLDQLVARVPALSGLPAADRRSLVEQMRVHEAAPGLAIVRQGETSDVGAGTWTCC